MIVTELVERLLATVSVVDIVGRRVELKKRGREHIGLCPFHSEHTPSFTVNESKKFFHCFGCSAHSDVIGFVMRTENLAFPDAAMRLAVEAGLAHGEGLKPIDRAELERQRERRRQQRELAGREEAAKQHRVLDIWQSGQPIAGTRAEIYLRGRGIDPNTLLTEPAGWPETLAYSSDASTEIDGRSRPALIVAVNDARTGLVRGLQRIFLNPNGSPVLIKKGDKLKKVKLSLGSIKGNAAQFSSWPDPDGRWGIAEGLETALAATQLFGFPVWSAISSGNMPNIAPPSWCRYVTIFADHDDGGLIAAADARARYLETLSIASVRMVAAARKRADMADLVKGVA